MMFFGPWMMIAGILLLSFLVAVPVALVAAVAVLLARTAKR
jgi:hypothetical protein